ncbi:hypothetical protein ABBQ38_15566 [Trebouxia sp. C0009 RCD-2024]
MGSDDSHVGGCFMWRCIVLLHLPIASPFPSILEQFIALWDEMIMQHISVLILSYPSVRALSLGIDVFAGLLLCSSHKPEAGCPMVAYAHVHMSQQYCACNNPPCGWCAPPASRFAHSMQSEVLAVSDHDSAP